MDKRIRNISNSQFTLQDCSLLDDDPQGTFISGAINKNGKKLFEMYNTKNALYIKDFK